MSDLISRQIVITTIQNYFKGLIDKGVYSVDAVDCSAILNKYVISDIPTAYDVDKVVEQIYNNGVCTGSKSGFILLEKAVSIVKGAVKDE